MTQERNTERPRADSEERQDARLPFDRRAWADTNNEAQESLRRQYGREARYGDS